MDVSYRPVDDLLGHFDPRVAAAPQPLDLSDGCGAFIKAAAVLGAQIAPSPRLRLSSSGKLHRPRQDIDQLFPTCFVLLLSQHLGEEQHGEAVAVGIPIIAAGVADQSVRVAATDQILDRQPNVFGILALRGGGTLAQEGIACQGGHGGGITAVIGGPMPDPRLAASQPVQSALDQQVDLRFVRRRRSAAAQQQNQGDRDADHAGANPVLGCSRAVHGMLPAIPERGIKSHQINRPLYLPAGFPSELLSTTCRSWWSLPRAAWDPAGGDRAGQVDRYTAPRS